MAQVTTTNSAPKKVVSRLYDGDFIDLTREVEPQKSGENEVVLLDCDESPDLSLINRNKIDKTTTVTKSSVSNTPKKKIVIANSKTIQSVVADVKLKSLNDTLQEELSHLNFKSSGGHITVGRKGINQSKFHLIRPQNSQDVFLLLSKNSAAKTPDTQTKKGLKEISAKSPISSSEGSATKTNSIVHAARIIVKPGSSEIKNKKLPSDSGLQSARNSDSDDVIMLPNESEKQNFPVPKMLNSRPSNSIARKTPQGETSKVQPSKLAGIVNGKSPKKLTPIAKKPAQLQSATKLGLSLPTSQVSLTPIANKPPQREVFKVQPPGRPAQITSQVVLTPIIKKSSQGEVFKIQPKKSGATSQTALRPLAMKPPQGEVFNVQPKKSGVTSQTALRPLAMKPPPGEVFKVQPTTPESTPQGGSRIVLKPILKKPQPSELTRALPTELRAAAKPTPRVQLSNYDIENPPNPLGFTAFTPANLQEMPRTDSSLVARTSQTLSLVSEVVPARTANVRTGSKTGQNMYVQNNSNSTLQRCVLASQNVGQNPLVLNKAEIPQGGTLGSKAITQVSQNKTTDSLKRTCSEIPFVTQHEIKAVDVNPDNDDVILLIDEEVPKTVDPQKTIVRPGLILSGGLLTQISKQNSTTSTTPETRNVTTRPSAISGGSFKHPKDPLRTYVNKKKTILKNNVQKQNCQAAPSTLADIVETASAVAAITPGKNGEISSDTQKKRTVYFLLYPVDAETGNPVPTKNGETEKQVLGLIPAQPSPLVNTNGPSLALGSLDKELTDSLYLTSKSLLENVFMDNSIDVQIEPAGLVTPVDIGKIINQGKKPRPKDRCIVSRPKKIFLYLQGFTNGEMKKSSCCSALKNIISKEESKLRKMKKNAAKYNFVHCGNDTNCYLPETVKNEMDDAITIDDGNIEQQLKSEIFDTPTLPIITEVISRVTDEMMQMRAQKAPKTNLKEKLAKPEEALKLIKKGLELIQIWSRESTSSEEAPKSPSPAKKRRSDQVIEIDDDDEDEEYPTPVKKARKPKNVKKIVQKKGEVMTLRRRGRRKKEELVEERMKKAEKSRTKEGVEKKKRGRKKKIVNMDEGDNDLFIVKRVDILRQNGAITKLKVRK